MMGWSLSDTERATWWQYQAALWNHNDRHEVPGQAPTEAPDSAAVSRAGQRIADKGLARTVH